MIIFWEDEEGYTKLPYSAQVIFLTVKNDNALHDGLFLRARPAKNTTPTM